MAKFLTRQQLYRLLQRELPEDLYADGAPEQYVSTAEMDSIAGVFSSAYSSMERIYANLFVTSCEEKINEFENSYFQETTSGLTLDERIARILAKIRSTDDISHWQILSTAATILDGIIVEVRQRNCLDNPITALLAGENADEVWGPSWVSGDPFPAGVTGRASLRTSQAELLAVRREAFAYDVFVFSASVPARVLALLDQTLSAQEPARSAHTVTQIDPTDFNFLEVGEIDRFDIDITGAKFDSGFQGVVPLWFGFDGDPYAAEFRDDASADPKQGGNFIFQIA